MTRIIVTLHGNERKALGELSESERRDVRAQAAMIIRRELERLGYMSPPQPEVTNAKHETTPA